MGAARWTKALILDAGTARLSALVVLVSVASRSVEYASFMPFRFGRKPTESKSNGGGPEPVSFDPAGGIRAVAAAAAQFADEGWRPVEAEYGESRDWDTRGAIASILREADPFDDWISNCPRSGFAHAVRGAQLLRVAWSIRGNGKAESVEKSAWGDFWAVLAEAEKMLMRATELSPDDPYPWSQLIWTGTGLEVSKDDILERFTLMQERDPSCIYGWLAVVSSLAKKWGGSHELMFAVAQHGDRELPAGSVGRVGIVRAHEERRLYLSGWENDSAGAANYFTRPEVVTEISAAASNSVLSDQHEPGVASRSAQSWFAYGLARVGERAVGERIRAADLFFQLGEDGIPADPWRTVYGSRAGTQYARIRNLCYREALSGDSRS
jgi:hypothetical protein